MNYTAANKVFKAATSVFDDEFPDAFHPYDHAASLVPIDAWRAIRGPSSLAGRPGYLRCSGCRASKPPSVALSLNCIDREAHDEAASLAVPVPCMLQLFLESDRGFARTREALRKMGKRDG